MSDMIARGMAKNANSYTDASLITAVNSINSQISALKNTSSFVNLNKSFNNGLGTETTLLMTRTIMDTSALNANNTPLSASVCPKYAKYSFTGSGTYVNVGKTILNTPTSTSYSIGAWIKKDILTDIPTGIAMRFIFSGVSIDLALNVSQSNLHEGYSTSASSGGASATLQVQKELNGWAYVSTIITNISSSATSFVSYIQPQTSAIPNGTNGVISVMNWTIIATDTILYSNSYSDTLSGTAKPYENKNIMLLGDSITAQNPGWSTYLQANLNPKSITNFAVNSATWKDKVGTIYDGNPVYNGADNNVNNVIGNQVQKILNGSYTTPDIIIIACGTNDTNDTTTIETQFTSSGTYIDISTVDRTTFAGAIRYAIYKLLNKYPNVQIFISLPIQSNETIRSAVGTKTKCDNIRTIAERLSIPTIDCYANSGIYGEFELNGTNGKYLVDGLHPNNAGQKKLGDYISRRIASWFSV